MDKPSFGEHMLVTSSALPSNTRSKTNLDSSFCTHTNTHTRRVQEMTVLQQPSKHHLVTGHELGVEEAPCQGCWMEVGLENCGDDEKEFKPGLGFRRWLICAPKKAFEQLTSLRNHTLIM
ncbi:hypothetical protein CRENBAI_021558 [Crenichthys baileyi]|uniref:Uncharacterized protein n=1 Tax=Crenichthys baileyi TaxID=28760 RepID=A0AAV9R391_9TELE